MKQEQIAKLSLAVIVILFVLFVAAIAKAMIIVDKRQVGTDDGYYTNRVTVAPYIVAKAAELTEGSPVGFRLDYGIEEIEMILDPFENEKVMFRELAYGV